MDLFGFVCLVLTGFTLCAEFGSYAFVHPVLRRLPREYHLQVEQGLLRTFGRVMPVLMTLSVVVSAELRSAYAPRQSRTLGVLRSGGFTRGGSLSPPSFSTCPSTRPQASGTPPTHRQTGRRLAAVGSSFRACGLGYSLLALSCCVWQ